MVNENVINELDRELSSYKSSLTNQLLLKYETLYTMYVKCAKLICTCPSYINACKHAKEVLEYKLKLHTSPYFIDLSYKEYVNNINTYALRAARELYSIELGYDKSKSPHENTNRMVLQSDEYKLCIGFNKSEKDAISYIKRKVTLHVKDHFAKMERTFIKHIQDNVKRITLLSYSNGCEGFEGKLKIDYEDNTYETVNLRAICACGPIQRLHYRYILTTISKRHE